MPLLRVDKNGNPINDEAGLINTVAQIQTGSVTVGQAVTSVTWVTVASIGFTTTRVGTVIGWINGNAKVTAGVGLGYVDIALDGSTPPASGLAAAQWANGDSNSNFGRVHVWSNIAAGSHTLYAVSEVQAGVTLTVTAIPFVAQLGA